MNLFRTRLVLPGCVSTVIIQHVISQADLSEFNPQIDSTHLTAEPTPDSFTTEPVDSFTAEPTADSFTAEPTADSFAAEPTADSFTAKPTADSFTAEATANSLPSFDTTNSSHSDMEIDHATLVSFELPDYTQEPSIDDSLPLTAAAAEPAPVEYIKTK